MSYETIIIDLLITAVAYLFVPFILMLMGVKMRKGKIKGIIIVNGIIIWLIFAIIRDNAGTEGTSAAVFLWSFVGYFLMKKRCLLQEKTADSLDDLSVEASENVSSTDKMMNEQSAINASTTRMSLSFENEAQEKEYGNYNVYGSDMVLQKKGAVGESVSQTVVKPTRNEQNYPEFNVQPSANAKRFCSHCGGIIIKKNRKCSVCGKKYRKIKTNNIIMVCLLLLLALTGAGLLYFYSISEDLTKENKELQASKDYLSSQVKDLKLDNSQLQSGLERVRNELFECSEKLDFIEEYVVFVEDDGTNYYHKLQCPNFLCEYFWAFNTEAAKGNGYEPCPYCCE